MTVNIYISGPITGKTRPELITANDMHEAVVAELTEKLESEVE